MVTHSSIDLDIPPHLVPPNPDDSDSQFSSNPLARNSSLTSYPVLPSQVHPSYPYGNPTNIKHPAARPRPPYDPTSRALFEDMGYAGGGINGALRWRDLALDELLPVDEEKEEALRAVQARKMASGASGHNPQPQQHQPHPPPDQTIDEEEEDEGDEDDENEDADGEEEPEEEDLDAEEE